MSPARRLRAYLIALFVFLALDFLWLGIVAEGVYQTHLGPIMRPDIQWTAAIAFYLLYVAGVVVFVVEPAVARESWRFAAGRGAFFGLVAYATFDLTALATLQGFPAAIVGVDLAWGTVLTAAVALAGYRAGRTGPAL